MFEWSMQRQREIKGFRKFSHLYIYLLFHSTCFSKMQSPFHYCFFFPFSMESQSIPTLLNSSQIAYQENTPLYILSLSQFLALLCSRKEPRFGYHYWITSPTKQELKFSFSFRLTVSWLVTLQQVAFCSLFTKYFYGIRWEI